ncbi:HAD family hydrolase [Pseudothermotoga sp. U03pept]|uniref:HAD family hydrolase n=1 Tax=Pseudothermotoga sp. U03pept TaxID=3447012 RepID=UPI003F068D82
MISAVIFDMDGVLIETESIYKETFKTILSRYGVNFSDRDFAQLTGRTLEKGGARNIIDRFRLPVDEKTFVQDVYRIFNQLSRSMKPREGVVEVLELMKESGVKIAVATSTVREIATTRLEKSGLVRFFNTMVFGDEVEFSKPDPQIYLEALKRLGTQSTETVVFEDSVSGVRAAIQANIPYVFGVLHEHNNADDLVKAGVLCAERPPEIFHFFFRICCKLGKK